jgi:hypothetical protein
MKQHRAGLLAVIAGALLAAAAPRTTVAEPVPAPSYADLVDLADSAPLVVRATIRRQAQLEPERARGVRPGWARLYLTGRVEGLLLGKSSVNADQAWLADLPLDARGRPPKLSKQSVLLFARPVAGRPGELQLVTPDAMVPWTAEREAQVRAIIAELLHPDAPPAVRGVREAIHVAGSLAGEGETQLFLAAANGAPVAITVTRRSGEPPQWAASFSEVVAVDGRPPARNTLAWYRLACFLPPSLPPGANLSERPAERRQAAEDYALVIRDLGPCPRHREFGLPR